MFEPVGSALDVNLPDVLRFGAQFKDDNSKTGARR